MPEEEIEEKIAEPDADPIPGLGDPPEEDDKPDDGGYVCMPADLVNE
jgi:hypothetical protein